MEKLINLSTQELEKLFEVNLELQKKVKKDYKFIMNDIFTNDKLVKITKEIREYMLNPHKKEEDNVRLFNTLNSLNYEHIGELIEVKEYFLNFWIYDNKELLVDDYDNVGYLNIIY